MPAPVGAPDATGEAAVMARYRRRVSGKFAASAVAAGVILAAAQGHGHPGGGRGAVTVAASGGSNEALANQMAASGYGWTGPQAACLDDLWQRESGFSQYADTRKSGLDPPGAAVFAYGIAQARPATKYPLAGRPPDLGGNSDPTTQITWGLEYLHDAYGSPCGGWSHEVAAGWY
jgi:hypothetical protein